MRRLRRAELDKRQNFSYERFCLLCFQGYGRVENHTGVPSLDAFDKGVGESFLLGESPLAEQRSEIIDIGFHLRPSQQFYFGFSHAL